MKPDNIDLVKVSSAYFTVKKYVINKGYSDEIDHYQDLSYDNITSADFMKETTWVILSSGMNEKVIRKLFPKIADLFSEWHHLDKILAAEEHYYSGFLKIFNNRKKADAIFNIAKTINDKGFEFIKYKIQNEGVTYLQSLPFIGKATSYHLAKNLGVNCAKPDRHLLRIANALGYQSPHDLCLDIASMTDEKETVVDLVLWRYATLNKQYVNMISRYLIN